MQRGESRGELLSWINGLLDLSITKIESVGSGAVLCQIMDTIYHDVPMQRVKFSANHEYEYVNNFKVLQACFNQHHIDKMIPVDKLIKLRFQDNLEFLQWIKKFWDSNYSTADYDPQARRRSSVVKPTSSVTGTSTRASGSMVSSPPPASAPISRNTASSFSSQPTPRKSQITNNTQNITELQETITKLSKNLTESRIMTDEMEKERDFYFGKLRDIETLCQETTAEEEIRSPLYLKITDILYKTEEGFEIPEASA